jgi:hypothetical protein
VFFPLKCGIQVVALSIILLAVAQFFEVFYQLLNDNIDWYYVLVGCLLLIPIVVAFAFAIAFFADEGDTERVLLRTGLILTLVSITLSAAWNAVYFWFIYKVPEVTTGNDGVGFLKVTKKQEIVFSIYIAVVIDAFVAYFICITTEYIECYREDSIKKWIDQNILAGGDEESKPLKEDEDKKKDDDAKDDAAAGDAKDGEEPKDA